MATSLRFVLICRAPLVPDWQYRCLRLLLETEGVHPLAVLCETSVESGQRARPGGIWGAYLHLYVRRRARSERARDIRPLLPGVPVQMMECEDDLIRRLDQADFILHLGDAALNLDGLSQVSYGIWTFDFLEDERWSGQPAYVGEILDRSPLIELALIRLGARAGERTVLQRGVLKAVDYSYPRALDSLHYAGVTWPARVCRDIQNGAASYLTGSGIVASPSVDSRPRPTKFARLLAILLRARVTATLRYLFIEEDWNVGMVEDAIENVALSDRLPSVRWLPPGEPGRFLADPFALEVDGELDILAEEFDPESRLGRIVALTETEGAWTRRRAIEAPFHLAYPYLMRDGSEVYCVPDSSQCREVALYRATRFPDSWERVETLLREVAAADSTIIRHDGRWWLFCTVRDMGGATGLRTTEGGAHTTLCAWLSESLMGPWKPHPANPLKIDVRSSRPAGTPFVSGGVLYRPAQNCSGTYGGAVTINRVTCMSPVAYGEEAVAELRPDSAGPYPDGLHTITAVGPRTIIDAKREYVSLIGAMRKARHLAWSAVRMGGDRPGTGAAIPVRGNLSLEEPEP